jgi:two-component system, OmpR family, sensor histidine kinase MtrB
VRRTELAPWRSLRGRATLAFGAVTLGLAVVMGVGVWLAVSQYLLAQREEVTLTQTATNAIRLERRLDGAASGPAAPVADVLAQLPRATGSVSLARYQGAWFTTSLTLGPETLPASLRTTVLEGTAARQRFEASDGAVRLAVGVPLGGGGAYFEVFALEDLDRAAEALGVALGVTVILAPLLGMLLGRWATRPALRPLDTLSRAAGRMADGDLAVRIDPGDDRDLALIAASFNRTADALEHRVRSDARFAADVSHELRSPLTTIIGTTDLLQSYRRHLPAEAGEIIDLLRSEVTRFERLVADLLEISRSDAGSADLVLEDVRLADLVEHALAPVHRTLLRIEPPAGAAVVRTDKRRFERVLANLVENAQVHGRGLTRVTVRVQKGRIWVLIDDAGPGVAAADRERVFERFARTRSTARTSTEGAGLGLALVDRHIRLLDGTIEIHDSPDGGARFAVGLPLRRAR